MFYCCHWKVHQVGLERKSIAHAEHTFLFKSMETFSVFWGAAGEQAGKSNWQCIAA